MTAAPACCLSGCSVVAAAAKGKHIVITGANTGIGFESARELAQKDFRITLACRDDAKAAAAVQRIKCVLFKHVLHKSP